tara:strand:+ start:95 stop:364 length:270 start_codon:yes stop_codon:yes gene_type:complete
MKVENMKNGNGNIVKNQFIISGDLGTQWFQSYDSTIVAKHSEDCIFLDKNYWNYSRTTSKYRNIFLNETTKETEAKIKNGTYSLIDLNR